MKNVNLIIFTLATFICYWSENAKLTAKYLGFEYHVYPGGDLNILKFELKNNTPDTLYISRRNLSIIVKKGNLILNEDKKSSSIGSPFFYPKMRKQFNCEERSKYEALIERLKFKYAAQLYHKNFNQLDLVQVYKEPILETIIKDCIILMPFEAIDYERHFYNGKFDKASKVEISYVDDRRFTYFTNDQGKIINIYQ